MQWGDGGRGKLQFHYIYRQIFLQYMESMAGEISLIALPKIETFESGVNH